MLLGLLPFIIAWFALSSTLDQYTALEHQVIYIQDQAFNREQKQSTNMAVRSHFRDANHFYIDKHLEVLSFLEPEIESLKGLLNNPNFPADENVKKRLDMLTGNGNTMVFTEGVVQSTPIFQEVTETLAHPIEVNVTDIQKILCYVEGIPIGPCTPPPQRPQLLVLNFKIDRKNVSEKNQVFLLNLKLLKREFQ